MCIKIFMNNLTGFFYLMKSSQYSRQSAGYYNRNTFGSNIQDSSIIDLSRSDATDIEDNTTEINYINVVDKSEIEPCVYPQIQEIQYEGQKDKEQQTPLMVLTILTLDNKISQAEVINKNDPSNPLTVKYEFHEKYGQKNIAIFFFKTNLHELLNLKIKYREKPINFAWLKSKINIQLDLKGLMIQQQAVLHFHEVIQHNTNKGLQNYCLLVAQYILTTKYKCLNEKSTIVKFYKIFKDIFKSQIQSNKLMFKNYIFKDMSIHQIQYFLYFFYSIYRDKEPFQKLKEFQILSKFLQLDLSKEFKKVFEHKNYELFQKSYLLFLMKTFFLAAVFQKKDDETLRQISIWNILNQDDLTVKEILIQLQPFKRSFRKIFDEIQVKNKILVNSYINFQNFALYHLRYVQDKIWKVQQEQVNYILIKFIDNLAVKQRISAQKHELVKLDSFEDKIECLFVKDHKLKSQIRVGELYNKIKMCMNHSNYVGNYFMNVLKQYLIEALPSALIEDYQTTIIPLMMKPVIEQQSSILLHYFQKNEIKIDQLILLVKILQQMKDEQYNISVIEMMIIQFFAINPYFDQDFLELMIKQFSKEFPNIKATQRYRKSFPVFCEKIIHGIRQQPMRRYLFQWLESFKPNFI